MKPPDIKPLNPLVSPKMDVFLGGSGEVNQSRAEWCPSVALDPDAAAPPPPAAEAAPLPAAIGGLGEPAVREVELLPSKAVADLAAGQPDKVTPEGVRFSLFVSVDRDLDPETRARAIEALTRHATRVRWKQDTATVEIRGGEVKELLEVDGIAYVEPGQSLRGPEPIVAGTATRPPGDGRRVKAERRRHRDGAGVLVGIIDVGGFDFAHPDFLDPKGKTRWVAIWDQAGTHRPAPRPAPVSGGPGDVEALGYGAEILAEHMNTAIEAAPARNMAATSLEPQSQMVAGSHGTHVASIAAGNKGVASKALIAGVLVALRPEDLDAASSFYDSTRIADAVEYLLELAARLGEGRSLPLAINISLGTNGHAHDTSSTMARWIDNALTSRGRCVTVAAGNAGQVEPGSPTDRGFVKGRIHAGGSLPATNLRHELGWVVGDAEIADLSENELEIWYGPQDRFDVEVKPPGQPWIGPISLGRRIRNGLLGDGSVLSVYNEPYHPANGLNRISVILSPFFGPMVDGTRHLGPIASGEWRVRLTGVVVRDGRFDAWIERDDPARLPGTGRRWRLPSYFGATSYTPDRMINSLACAERVVSVGNADLPRNAAHVTSSRGPTRDGRSKPDIAADGTNVVAARGFDPEARWMAMTGTSMASPHVCGVAALMLGIHPGLTSPQIQGIIRSTSSPLPGHAFGWRNDTGFGVIDAAACVTRTAEFADMLKGAE